MLMERREDILNKVMRRIKVEYLGFTINGIASPCYTWQGPTSGTGRGGGYGRMALSGQTVAVHLVIYTHFFGYIPGKKQIDHMCNNRLCCNKDHLEMVTHLRNQRRRATRAKQVKTNAQTKRQTKSNTGHSLSNNVVPIHSGIDNPYQCSEVA